MQAKEGGIGGLHRIGEAPACDPYAGTGVQLLGLAVGRVNRDRGIAPLLTVDGEQIPLGVSTYYLGWFLPVF